MAEVVPVPLAEDKEDHLTAMATGPRPIPRPKTTEPPHILWPYAIGIVALHLLLPLAFVPWLFSWTGLLLVPVRRSLRAAPTRRPTRRPTPLRR